MFFLTFSKTVSIGTKSVTIEILFPPPFSTPTFARLRTVNPVYVSYKKKIHEKNPASISFFLFRTVKSAGIANTTLVKGNEKLVTQKRHIFYMLVTFSSVSEQKM